MYFVIKPDSSLLFQTAERILSQLNPILLTRQRRFSTHVFVHLNLLLTVFLE